MDKPIISLLEKASIILKLCRNIGEINPNLFLNLMKKLQSLMLRYHISNNLI